MLRPTLTSLADHISLRPDMSRALRATIAFMVPLLLATTGWISFDVSFVAIAAQNIAMVDARGDYRVRLMLLLAMVGVFAGAAAIGSAVAHNTAVAVLATGLMAVLGGVWRHVSSDYGPPLAISSTLVFFLALAGRDAGAPGAHALAAFLGGLWGVMVQIAQWPFRPQHGLRRSVADSWIGVADLFDCLAAVAATHESAPRAAVQEREIALRATLDQGYAALAAAPAGFLSERLQPLQLAAARLATRVVALHTALEAILTSTDLAVIGPTLEAALNALGNLGRSVALTTVSRQPGHLAAFEVRLREVSSLLGVLRTRLSHDSRHAQVAEIVRQIERTLPETHGALRATVERAEERDATSLELPDLRAQALRPLASALNLSGEFEPALVRYTLRLAALTMIGVLIFKRGGLPHGYWLPFTTVVVLQPDYGSTRQRAGQRALGTLAGSIAASALLWLHLPLAGLMLAAATTMLAFGFYLKRNYAIAMFFVTLFLVLLTEAHEPVTIAFTLERLASTVAGGLLALLAAFVFWPVWERDRLPGILGQMFAANREYLGLLLARLAAGTAYDAPAIQAKRRAESANSAAFSSLRRLNGDPQNRREGLEHAAALVNGNQRLTRILNVLSLHLTPGVPRNEPGVTRFAELAARSLQELGAAVEVQAQHPGQFKEVLDALELLRFPEAKSAEERWIFAQLARASTELSALLVTLEEAAP